MRGNNPTIIYSYRIRTNLFSNPSSLRIKHWKHRLHLCPFLNDTHGTNIKQEPIFLCFGKLLLQRSSLPPPELITVQQLKDSPGPAGCPTLREHPLRFRGLCLLKSFSGLDMTSAYEILPCSQLQLLIIQQPVLTLPLKLAVNPLLPFSF